MTAPNTSSALADEPNGSRLQFLDGLRGIAILLVIGYHYFSRFDNDLSNLYPYGNLLADAWIFQYGYYGVHLFFAISGFVIAMSLERSHSFMDFALKRFARLWPTMLLCSALTFTVLSIWPMFWPQHWGNFLPSLTFIDPLIWNRMIPTLETKWIDGVYWTLFVEVRFYFLAALLYWISGRFFLQSIMTASTISVVMHVVSLGLGKESLAFIFEVAGISKYWPWFLLGIAARYHFLGKNAHAKAVGVLAGLQLFLLVYSGMPKIDTAVFVLIAAILATASSNAALRSFLEARWLVAVGVASYSLYLLHQNAGLTLISNLSRIFNLSGWPSVVVAILVFLLILLISRFIYRRWESPLNRFLVDQMGGRGRNRSTMTNTAASTLHIEQR